LVDFGCLNDHDRCCSLTSGVFGELDRGALAVVKDRNGEPERWRVNVSR
jgi:hypothetical protein